LKEASGSHVSSVSSSALCAVCQKQFVSAEEFENVTTKTAIRLLCYRKYIVFLELYILYKTIKQLLFAKKILTLIQK